MEKRPVAGTVAETQLQKTETQDQQRLKIIHLLVNGASYISIENHHKKAKQMWCLHHVRGNMWLIRHGQHCLIDSLNDREYMLTC
jgi:hypothetical protein